MNGEDKEISSMEGREEAANQIVEEVKYGLSTAPLVRFEACCGPHPESPMGIVVLFTITHLGVSTPEDVREIIKEVLDRVILRPNFLKYKIDWAMEIAR